MNALVVVYGLMMVAGLIGCLAWVGFIAWLRWDIRAQREIRDLERRIAQTRVAPRTGRVSE
jgi:hypothetical protein